MERTFAGKLKSFGPKGYGFITCAETFEMLGKDVFVLGTELPNDCREKDTRLQFCLQEDKERPEAVHVRRAFGRAGMPQSAPRTGDVARTSFTGVLKSFSVKTGYGMIECPQTYKVYNKDMFVMMSAFTNGIPSPGQMVRFNVVEGMKGMEAADVYAIGGGVGVPFVGSHGAVVGGSRGVAHSPRAHCIGQQAMVPVQQVVAMVQQAREAILPEPPYYGHIKSFSEQNGWGMIESKLMRKYFGKDMFVMKTAISTRTAAAGDLVKFRVKRGKAGVEATAVSVLPPDCFASDSGRGQMYMGSVKSFSEKDGWGFVSCEATADVFDGRDIFLHQKHLDGYVPKPDEPVSFTVFLNRDSRPEATSLSFAPQGVLQPKKVPRGCKYRASPY